MPKSVQGPGGGQGPIQPPGGVPEQAKTGIEKSYTAAKAPGFAKMLEYWFPGTVTPKMVSAFEQGVMQMIQNSLNEAKRQHKKVQEEIKKRIDEQNQ